MESNPGQTALEKLFQLLEPGARSVEEGFRLCRFKLIKFFAWRRCEDPDNLADETISRLLKNVRAGLEISATNPYSYVYAIALNVYKEYARAKMKAAALRESDEARRDPTPPTADDCQRQCFERLPQEKQALLVRYYLEGDDPQEIARDNGLTLNAMRLQIHRIKQGLRRCCEDCRKPSGVGRN